MPRSILLGDRRRLDGSSRNVRGSLFLLSLALVVSSAGSSEAKPCIAFVNAAPGGYTIEGSGFGTDPSAVTLIEGSRTARSKIQSLADGRIEVRSNASRVTMVAVTVGRQRSNTTRFVPGRSTRSPVKCPPAAAGGTAPAPPSTTSREGALPAPPTPPSTTSRDDAASAPPAPQTRSSARPPAAAASVVITKIDVAPNLYTIRGSGFGRLGPRSRVLEDGRPVPANQVMYWSPTQIRVRSQPAKGAKVRVAVGEAESPEFALAESGVPKRPVVPSIAKITETPQGYRIEGRDLGNDPSQVVVYEAGRALPGSAVVSATATRIDVRSAPAGQVGIVVAVAGVKSASTIFEPTPEAPSPKLQATVPERDPSAPLAPRAGGTPVDVDDLGRRARVPTRGEVQPRQDDRTLSDRSGPPSGPGGPRSRPALPSGSAPSVPGPEDLTPRIDSARRIGSSYVLVGSKFGNDRSVVTVYEADAAVPDAKISFSPTEITVDSNPQESVDVSLDIDGFRTKAFRLPPPTVRTVVARDAPVPPGEKPPGVSIESIEVSTGLYVLRGRGFGRTSARTYVYEGDRQVPANQLMNVSDTRITVRSSLSEEGTEIKVVANGQESNVVVYGSPLAEEDPRAAQPVIEEFEEIAGSGYHIRGRNFGEREDQRVVFENGRAVAPESGYGTRLRMGRTPEGPVGVVVQVNGVNSASVIFEPTGCDDSIEITSQVASAGRITLEAPYDERKQWFLCGPAGYGRYEWSLADIRPPNEATGYGSFLRVSNVEGRRAGLAIRGIEAAETYLEARIGGVPVFRVQANLHLTASAPKLAGQGLPQTQQIDVPLEFRMTDIPDLPPKIERYWIEEYRPGRSGTLENAGILDPSVLADKSPTHGVVNVEGKYLHTVPPAEFLIGDQRGEVLERRSTRSGVDTARIRFSNFAGQSQDLNAQNRAGRSSKRAPRLSYRVIQPVEFSVLGGNIEIVLGDPVGEGSLRVGDAATDLVVPPLDDGIVKVDILDLHSDDVFFDFLPSGQAGTVVFRIEIPFETDGNEFEGTVLEKVGFWSCKSIRIDQRDCPFLDLGCFAQSLGDLFSGAGECLNPESWSEDFSIEGPGIEFAGQLTSPRLILDTPLQAAGENGIVGLPLTARFEAGVSVRTGDLDIPRELIEGWALESVGGTLQEAVAQMGLEKVIAPQVQRLIFRADGQEVRELILHPRGLFVDLTGP